VRVRLLLLGILTLMPWLSGCPGAGDVVTAVKEIGEIGDDIEEGIADAWRDTDIPRAGTWNVVFAPSTPGAQRFEAIAEIQQNGGTIWGTIRPTTELRCMSGGWYVEGGSGNRIVNWASLAGTGQGGSIDMPMLFGGVESFEGSYTIRYDGSRCTGVDEGRATFWPAT